MYAQTFQINWPIPYLTVFAPAYRKSRWYDQEMPTFSLNDNKPTMDSQGLFVTGHNDAKNQAVLYRLNK